MPPPDASPEGAPRPFRAERLTVSAPGDGQAGEGNADPDDAIGHGVGRSQVVGDGENKVDALADEPADPAVAVVQSVADPQRLRRNRLTRNRHLVRVPGTPSIEERHDLA
jgi:hypothetical protein